VTSSLVEPSCWKLAVSVGPQMRQLRGSVGSTWRFQTKLGRTATTNRCLPYAQINLGGWPTLIQSEISWGKKHPAAPEYVFQINTTQKGNWMWGDNGTAKGRRDEWALDWQCY
jgi:hypothetical protein